MAKKNRIEDQIRALFQLTPGPMTSKQISELLELSQSSVCVTLRLMRGAWVTKWEKPKGKGRWFAYWDLNPNPKTPTPKDAPHPPKVTPCTPANKY